MNTATNDTQTEEYTIFFFPKNITMVSGGIVISGATLQKSRKQQHRHSNPSAMARLKRTRRKRGK